MTWWNVNLDGVALINLIMCIGFSVDFSAHICYHYITCSESDLPGKYPNYFFGLLSWPRMHHASNEIPKSQDES